MRSTSGYDAARLMRATCLPVKTLGSTARLGLVEHRRRLNVLPLFCGKPAVRHRRQPDVGVEPDLMAGMPGYHRAAARLRDVANKQARPTVELLRVLGKLFNEGDQLGMSPITIAR